MSEAITQGVRVQVESEYIKDKSDPERSEYLFVYHVKISNEGTERVQLISRHWVITNPEGNEEHVRGPGVIGEQPIIEPGENHSYSSFCPLKTPFGTMHGSYQMITESQKNFDAKIAPFRLIAQEFLH